MNKNLLISGAILAALAVSIGAFGAHALQETLLANKKSEVFETASKYHFYHALGLLFMGVLSHQIKNKWLQNAGVVMIFGIVIFSGSLYLLAITNYGYLGAITPIGGVLFIVSWVMLVIAVIKTK